MPTDITHQEDHPVGVDGDFFHYNRPVSARRNAMSNQEAKTEKRSAALSSVVYAVFLTTFKLIIGLLTNSLGILAEAAHSGLDLVAAATTYFAVRVSDKPADKEHHMTRKLPTRKCP